MKKILLLSVFTFATMVMWGQEVLTIEPNPVIVMDITVEITDAPGHSTLTNAGNTGRTIVWEKKVIEKTESWDVAVCDINNCYFPSVDSKSVVLAAGASSNLDVHAYPNGTPGYAIVEMKCYDSADTTVVNVGHYYFNYDPNGTRAPVVKKDFTLYPNPTSNFFSIKEDAASISRVVVYDLLGKEVKRFDPDFDARFDVSELSKGNYLVQILDKEGRTLSTKVLQKI